MCKEYTEAYSSLKDLYKWAKYGFATTILSPKDSTCNENTLTDKVKNPGTVII